MQHAFSVVLFVVVGASIVVGLFTLSGSRKAYDEIGKGGLFEDESAGRKVEASYGGSAAVRSEEIRQMLEARNARRERRGEATVDVETELAELTKPRMDPALLAEIRDLVEARSARRVRRGEPPLDIDAEVARKLLEFG